MLLSLGDQNDIATNQTDVRVDASGEAGNDVLYGGSAGDSLDGGAGSSDTAKDVIDGGAHTPNWGDHCVVLKAVAPEPAVGLPSQADLADARPGGHDRLHVGGGVRGVPVRDGGDPVGVA